MVEAGVFETKKVCHIGYYGNGQKKTDPALQDLFFTSMSSTS